MSESATSYQPPPNGWRTFLIIWGTQSASVFGSAMTLFAMNIWLTQTLYPRPDQKPQLAAALAAINLAFAIPVVFGAPLAGAWADRHDRKRTMMVADFCNGALSLILAALVLSGSLQLWMLLVIIALMAFLSAFHGAAFDTSYAMLVTEERLPRANGMMQTMWALSGILAPAVAATLIALPALARNGTLTGPLSARLGSLSNGAALPILVDAVTFFLAAVTLIFLFVPSPKRTDLVGADGQVKKSVWADIKIGGLYIWQRRPLLWLLGTFAVANLCSGPLGVVQPLLVKFNLAASWRGLGFQYETALALLGTVTAIGGVVGGIFITAWGGLKARRVYGVVVPLIIAGVAQVAFGLSHWLYFSAAHGFHCRSHDADHERTLADDLADADAARAAGPGLCRAPVDRPVHLAAERRAGRLGGRPVRSGHGGGGVGRHPGDLLCRAVVQPVSAERGEQRDVGRHGCARRG